LLCRALKRLLLTSGIHAETFTSGREFLEVVQEIPSFKPECVVLDIHLPGFDGFQVHSRLSCMRPHVPVIFLTGAEAAHSREQALALGAVALFQKPLERDLDLLIQTLRMLLNVDGVGHA
jgi:FixJ family two-component response regulator